LCHALDDEGLSWFEEPNDWKGLRGLAQLTRAVRASVLIEGFYDLREVWRAVDSDACDPVVPDLMPLGGTVCPGAASRTNRRHGGHRHLHAPGEGAVHDRSTPPHSLDRPLHNTWASGHFGVVVGPGITPA
jgi:hypothetical protein